VENTKNRSILELTPDAWRKVVTERKPKRKTAAVSFKVKAPCVQFCGNLNWKAIPRPTFEAEVHSSSLNVNAFPFRFLFTLATCVFSLLLVILFGVWKCEEHFGQHCETILCSSCFSFCLPALATGSRLILKAF
jgi:hypothetical protein